MWTIVTVNKLAGRPAFRTPTFWFIGRVLPLLVAAVALFFFASLLVRLDQDTTPITNAAFAVIATLAALCLSAARATDGDARAFYARAGEGLLLAALLGPPHAETKEFQRWTAKRRVELLLQLIRRERKLVDVCREHSRGKRGIRHK
jgi:hypothetical protein